VSAAITVDNQAIIVHSLHVVRVLLSELSYMETCRM